MSTSEVAAAAATVVPAAGKPELFVRETEFFGFTPVSFVDDVINSVNEYLYQAMSQLQLFFVEHGKRDRAHSKEEVQKGLDKVVTLLEAAVDRNFDKFELYVLKNIFRVPAGVRLPHQQNLNFSHTAEEEAEMDRELDELEKRVESARYTHHVLNQEYLLLQRMTNVLEKWETQLRFVTEITEQHGGASLAEDVKVVVGNFDDLKGLVAEVASLSGILAASETQQAPGQSLAGAGS